MPAGQQIVTGPRTGVMRYPGGPIDRLPQRGDTVIGDLSVRVSGYWSACTNTLVVGAEPSAEQHRYVRAACSSRPRSGGDDCVVIGAYIYRNEEQRVYFGVARACAWGDVVSWIATSPAR